MASWSLLSLSSLLSDLGEPESTFELSAALDRVATTLDAEFAIVVDSSRADGPGQGPGHGFGAGSGPSTHVVSANIDDTADSLVIGRSERDFDPDEVGFVIVVARVIAMAQKMHAALVAERSARHDLENRVEDNRKLVGQLRERQGLLDRLFRIQQSISHRLPTQEVLDAVTEGATDLLGIEQASLRLVDPEDAGSLLLVSHHGVAPEEAARYRELRLGDRIPPEVITEGRLVVRYDVDGLSLMSAAVTVDGVPVGCLSVGDPRESYFSPPEQEALVALAQHAALALQDARATDAMRQALDRERHRAEHDSLTRLPNRATVRRDLAERLERVDAEPVVVLFVDLDRFKLANDTLGHAFGDEVLRVVGERLRTVVRSEDLVGRLSGDEFVVICSGMTEVGGVEFAERLQEVIAKPVALDGVTHVISASVGIASPTADETADQILANADLAMYRAKQRGRSRIDVFDTELRDQVEERLEIGQDLRQAIDEDQFDVFLQPVVALPTRRVTGFEALVRWNHPTRGLLLPKAFVAFAEELGVIAEIDRIMMSRVIKLLAAHDNARPIAVNLSARTFSDVALVDWLAAELSQSGVDAGRVVIEVTETVLMDQSGANAAQMSALRDLGIRIMIDDFGTGYSSLSYLQNFEVDGVKIDRSFVGRLGEDVRAEAIVAAVFNMARALDFVVVAEGVETDNQVAELLRLHEAVPGVDLFGQGYLFGYPVVGEARLGGFVEVPLVASR